MIIGIIYWQLLIKALFIKKEEILAAYKYLLLKNKKCTLWISEQYP